MRWAVGYTFGPGVLPGMLGADSEPDAIYQHDALLRQRRGACE